MVKKSFLTAFIFLCVYSLYVTNFKTSSASQNQNQDNLVKAQQYMFANHVPENVIVGTSLSCHLHTDSLKKFYNLAFNGSSIYDGLNVILNGNKLPEKVFIETNLYLNNKSEQLSSQLYNLYPLYTSKIIPIFRYENQPIGKLVFCLNPIGDKIVLHHNNFMKRVKEKIELQQNPSVIKKKDIYLNVFNQMLNLQKENFKELPLKKEIIFKLKELKVIVSKLKNKGVEVVFFEMPINSDLSKSIRAKLLRKKLTRFFLHKVRFIPLDTTKYITSDGVHLNDFESIVYTKYFRGKIMSIIE
jgi:hydroxymethylpyrimidine pyrophosphatase-like HAD family hydrolase